jgi:hypothetical protein
MALWLPLLSFWAFVICSLPFARVSTATRVRRMAADEHRAVPAKAIQRILSQKRSP